MKKHVGPYCQSEIWQCSTTILRFLKNSSVMSLWIVLVMACSVKCEYIFWLMDCQRIVTWTWFEHVPVCKGQEIPDFPKV